MRKQPQGHSVEIARLRSETPRRIICERAGERRIRAVVFNWGGFYFEMIYTFNDEDLRWHIRTDMIAPDVRWSKGPDDFERFVKSGKSIASEMLECFDLKVMPSVAKWALENNSAITGDGHIGEESNPTAWGYELANVPGTASSVKKCLRLAAELRRVAGIAWECRAELRKLVAEFKPEREAA